jgi:peroxiredoxin
MGTRERRLEPGAEAPDFEAEAFDGRVVRLSGLAARGPVVLVFLRGFS